MCDRKSIISSSSFSTDASPFDSLFRMPDRMPPADPHPKYGDSNPTTIGIDWPLRVRVSAYDLGWVDVETLCFSRCPGHSMPFHGVMLLYSPASTQALPVMIGTLGGHAQLSSLSLRLPLRRHIRHLIFLIPHSTPELLALRILFGIGR